MADEIREDQYPPYEKNSLNKTKEDSIAPLFSVHSWIKDAENFKLLMDNIAVIMSVYSNPHYIYVNSNFTKILGYTREEALKMNFWDLVHPDHREMAKDRGLARLRGEAAPINDEFKAVKKNGEIIWLNHFFSVDRLGSESIVTNVSFDITEGKRLKQDLQSAHDESELRVKQRTEELSHINQELIYTNQNLQNILNNIAHDIVTVSRSGKFEILNERFSPKSNMSPMEINTKLKDLFMRGRIPFVNRMFEENEPFHDKEIKLITTHSHINWLASGTPIFNEEGVVNSGVISLRSLNEVHRLVSRFSGFRATFHFNDIITDDHWMRALIKTAQSAALNMSNVIIYGESGTGKELFAQAIHNESPRKKGPFLAVNCGAIPRELIGSELFGYAEGAFTGARKGGNPGKFELADGGSIFLDEIGDLPFEQQAAILRVIQERTLTRVGGNEVISVDVRIICATNKDISLEMQRGSFREDLYYRLNVINIKIFPLRKRPSDITLLFKHFLKIGAPKFSKTVEKINDDVLECLLNYPWPGNVRELQNVVERILNTISGSTLELDHLPSELKQKQKEMGFIPSGATPPSSDLTVNKARTSSKKTITESEKNEIVRLIEKHHGNISRIASELGISRPTLYKKMRNYSLYSK